MKATSGEVPRGIDARSGRALSRLSGRIGHHSYRTGVPVQGALVHIGSHLADVTAGRTEACMVPQQLFKRAAARSAMRSAARVAEPQDTRLLRRVRLVSGHLVGARIDCVVMP